MFSFEEFVMNEAKRVDAEANKFVEEVQSVMHKKIWEGISTSTYFSTDEKQSLYLVINEAGVDGTVLNESILGVMRKAVGKLADKGVKIKEEALDKLETIMKSASAFAKYLKDLFIKAWDKLLGYFQKKYAGLEDVMKKAAEKTEFKEKLLKKGLALEVKNLKETMSFWLKTFRNKISDAITNIYPKEVLKECLDFNGDLIMELSTFDLNSIPLTEADDAAADTADAPEGGEAKKAGPWSFLNKIKHKLEHIPPFVWLEKIAEIGAKGAELFLNKFSEITKKAGGPGAYEFVGLATMMGLAFEYKIKHLGVDHIKDILQSEALLRLLPMAKEVIEVVEWIAICLMVIKIAEELMKEGAEGGPDAKTSELPAEHAQQTT